MSLNCNICNKELDAFSGGRCKICRNLVCKDCVANGGAQKKDGIICIKCAEEQYKASLPKKKEEQPPPTAEPVIKPRKSTTAFIVITAFTLLMLFIYIIAIPYIKARNALQIIEFGPEEKMLEAKNSLTEESGSYILDELEDMANNGRKNTAIRAVQTLGAQPGTRSILILKELQLNPETPEYLQSVIIEALLEHERLYEEQKTIN